MLMYHPVCHVRLFTYLKVPFCNLLGGSEKTRLPVLRYELDNFWLRASQLCCRLRLRVWIMERISLTLECLWLLGIRSGIHKNRITLSKSLHWQAHIRTFGCSWTAGTRYDWSGGRLAHHTYEETFWVSCAVICLCELSRIFVRLPVGFVGVR
jgi:hypothetical protein